MTKLFLSMRKNQRKKSDPIAKDLLVSDNYKHIIHKSKKERLSKQEIKEWEDEIKEYTKNE